jgi:hypothetical protein
MQFNIHKRMLLGGLPLLLIGSSAFGGIGGVDVKIVNDGTEDVVVTVYDMSTEPRSVVLAHERMNGFTTVPLSLAADASGLANISWTAVSADSIRRKCGHESKAGLADSAAVTVHADSECGN